MGTEKKDWPITSRISVNLYRELDELAKENRQPVSAMIRWILEEEVPKRLLEKRNIEPEKAG